MHMPQTKTRYKDQKWPQGELKVIDCRAVIRTDIPDNGKCYPRLHVWGKFPDDGRRTYLMSVPWMQIEKETVAMVRLRVKRKNRRSYRRGVRKLCAPRRACLRY